MRLPVRRCCSIGQPIAVLVLLVTMCCTTSGVEYTVDQSNTWEPLLGTGFNIEAFTPIGQEFVPQMASLDVVELVVDHAGPTGADPSEIAVVVHSGSILGEVLGISDSEIVLEDSPWHVVSFEFPETVPLVPGALHVIEAVHVAGAGSLLLITGSFPHSSYPYGDFIRWGETVPGGDLWFSEGPGEWSATVRSSWSSIKALYR